MIRGLMQRVISVMVYISHGLHFILGDKYSRYLVVLRGEYFTSDSLIGCRFEGYLGGTLSHSMGCAARCSVRRANDQESGKK